MLAAPNRIGVAPEVIRRTLDGRMKVAPDGTVRVNERYLLVGRKGAGRPEPVQAAWLYAQMVRWGQAPLSAELLARREGGVPPRSLRRGDPGDAKPDLAGEPADGIGAFAGPAFDPDDIAAHLAGWKIRRAMSGSRHCAILCTAQIFCTDAFERANRPLLRARS